MTTPTKAPTSGEDPKSHMGPEDAHTFASAMGQIVWLMTMSEPHKDLPIRTVENLIAPAILLKHFRLYSKGKQPVAVVIWASVSDAVKVRLDAGSKNMDMKDWRSGPHIVVVDVISPYTTPDVIAAQFMESVKKAQHKGQSPSGAEPPPSDFTKV